MEKDPSMEEIKRVMRYLGTRTAPTKRSEASRKAAASMDPNVKTARAKKAAAASAAVRSAKAKAKRGDPAAPQQSRNEPKGTA